MCGIAGVMHLTGQKVDRLPERIEVMKELLKHRGPDGHGTWVHAGGHVGLGHRRLDIIDLATGQQPMRSGRNWITFNGEIYNYPELRDELGRDEFATKSDTEVILVAYRRWGRSCVSR